MPIEITSAICHGKDEALVLERCQLDPPGPGEVLVRVVACGICHTDIAVITQDIPLPFPRVLGHEGSGIVEACGAGVEDLSVGDHVLMSFGSCGDCDHCNSEEPAYCTTFREINFAGERAGGPAIHQDGAPIGSNFFHQSSFATLALAQRRNVVKIDKDLPLDVLAPLGCGIQTGVGAVLNAIRPQAGDSFVVFGAGSVGLSSVMGAAIAGCSNICAVDLAENRLALARELGATHAFRGDDPDLVAKLREASGGGYHCGLDTTGIPAVVDTASQALRKRGMLALVAAPAPGTRYSVEARYMVGAGLSWRGVIEGDSNPPDFIPELIEYYRKGRLPVEKIIAHYPFEQINEAIHAMEDGSVVKPVLRMMQD